jgi:hypothetical protein
VWDLLWAAFVGSASIEDAVLGFLTALLQGAPPADLVVEMSLEDSRVVKEGAQLCARLPAYLARWAYTSLIAPLWALVSSYEEPTTVKELWATGPGTPAP